MNSSPQSRSRGSVLVTGCSSGFGKLIALTMGRNGYRVHATMRELAGRNAQAAHDLRVAANTDGVSIDVLELDVDSAQSVDAAVHSIVGEGECIDIVVNNAAMTAWGPSEAFDFEQVFRLYNTNLFGPWRVNKAILPHMRARGSGMIVHVTSVVGRVFRAGGLYPASKWAAEGLAECMAHELRPHGIDVVILEPGAYPTAWVGRGMIPADRDVAQAYKEREESAPAPVRPGPDFRTPDPQEIADEILRLAEIPAGERPLRTVVGHIYTEGVADYNAVYEATRLRLIESLRRSDQALPWL